MIVKLATVAPTGSPWHEALVEMGQEWERVTNGEVVLRIYPGGVAGDERDIMPKIRIGQLHAAAITAEGLSEISWDVNVYYIPLLFESHGELEVFQNELRPHLNAELEKSGFKVLAWSDIGWAYWFSRKPIYTPSDLKKHRLFNWMGDYYAADLWKKAGFHAVPMSFLDLGPSLQTGLVEAFATLPVLALSNQWFALAPHMLDLKWGFVMATIVIIKTKWDTIPVEYRKDLLAIAREMEDRISSRNRETVEQAINIMLEYGLEIHHLTQEQKNMWIELTESFYPHLRGGLVPEKIFDRAINLKAEFSNTRENAP